MPRKIFPPSVRGGGQSRLQKKHLEELEKVSKLSFSKEQKAQLQEIYRTCLIHSKFERKAVPGSSPTSVYNNLITQIGAVIDEFGRLQSETPQYHDVHLELNDELESLAPGATVESERWRLMKLQRVVIKTRDAHISHFGGPGRPMKNESQRQFIWALADLFEAAGGRAGVTYRSIDNSLRSRFLTYVTKINSFLPQRIRVSSTALPDLVREVCQARNKKMGRKRRRRAAT